MSIFWLIWTLWMGAITGGWVFRGNWEFPQKEICLGFVFFASGLLVPIFANYRWLANAGPEILGAHLLIIELCTMVFVAMAIVTNLMIWLTHKLYRKMGWPI